MRTLTVAGMAVCLACAQAAWAATLPADLAKAVKDYDLAQIQGNRAELERLLADDYTLLNSTGKVQSKADLIADYTAPGFKLEPYEVREPIEKVWDRGAVMGGIVTLRGVDADEPFSLTMRFADIWAKRSGVWQVIYTQVSRVPDVRRIGSDAKAQQAGQATPESSALPVR